MLRAGSSAGGLADPKVFAHGKPAILLARRIGKKGVLKGIASLTVPCNPFIRSADSGRSSLRRCRRFLCPLKSAARDAFMGHTQAAGQGREGGSPIASLDHACRTLSAIRKRAIVHWNPKSRDEAQTISTADLPEPFPFGPCLNLYRSLIGRTKDGYVTGWDTGAGASSFFTQPRGNRILLRIGAMDDFHLHIEFHCQNLLSACTVFILCAA